MQDPTSSQDYNRYSYCWNNPLKYTDPTGWFTYYYNNADGKYYDQWGDEVNESKADRFKEGDYGSNDNIKYTYNENWAEENAVKKILKNAGLSLSDHDNYSRLERGKIILRQNYIAYSEEEKDLLLYVNARVIHYTVNNGQGGAMETACNVANAINEWNPVAQLMDVVAYGFTGKDRFGNKMSMTQANLKGLAVAPIPIGKIASLVGKGAERLTYQIINRGKLGSDGGVSRHIIEKLDGLTISKTHQVFLEGEIIHQHQSHIGTYGTERFFPEEWLNYRTIDK